MSNKYDEGYADGFRQAMWFSHNTTEQPTTAPGYIEALAEVRKADAALIVKRHFHALERSLEVARAEADWMLPI